jgi:hypothetical protein
MEWVLQRAAELQQLPQNLVVAAVVLFGFVWLLHTVLILVGGEQLEQRIAGFRGNVFDNYRTRLTRRLDGFARWVGDDHPQGPLYFSGASFMVCFGLASFYPLLFLAFSWALLGGSGSFEGFQLFKSDATQVQRFLMLALMVGPSIAGGVLRYLQYSPMVSYLIVSAITVTVAVAVHVAGAGTVVAAGAGAIAVVFSVGFGFIVASTLYFTGAVTGALTGVAAFIVVVTLAVTGAVASAFGFNFAGAFDVTFAGALVVASIFMIFVFFIVVAADRRRQGWVAVVVIAFLLCVPALSIAFASGANWINELDAATKTLVTGSAPIVLFLALLPAINAPFDWMSLAITRFVLRVLAGTSEKVLWWWENPLTQVFVQPAVIFINFLLAATLAFMIVVATAGGMSLFNWVHEFAGGHRIIDVPAIIEQVRANPWDERWWWLYATMFWTLVPTLLHYLSFTGTLAALILKGGAASLANTMEAAYKETDFFGAFVASFWISTRVFMPAVLALFFVFQSMPSIFEFFGFGPERLGDELFQWAMWAVFLFQQ